MSKISVIIPVYNVSEYLEKCLWSVTNQTLQDIEIIVVNDGSTDNSLSILEKYAATDNRIIVINRTNGGVVSARKAGLNIAKGEYIHYLDGDDYMELNSYELLYNKAIETNADMIAFEFKWCLTEFKKITRTEGFKSNIDFILQSLKGNEFMSLGLNFHKRELYKNKIDFHEALTIGEDSYLVKQLAYYSKTVLYVGVGLYNYVSRECSIMHAKMTDKKVNDTLFQYELLLDFLKDKPEYNPLLEECIYSKQVDTNAYLFWLRYFKNGHVRAKDSIIKINKYPTIREMQGVKPLYKLMKLYATNSILGRLFAQYYIIKKKIK